MAVYLGVISSQDLKSQNCNKVLRLEGEFISQEILKAAKQQTEGNNSGVKF